MEKSEKTNVMRLLDKLGLPYDTHSYLASGAISGVDVAQVLGQDPARVFKTLVTTGGPGAYFVFLLPVAAELDLKKAAKCVGAKKIEMLKAKELLPLTGYIHGGCSPIGMKKRFPTVLDASAQRFERILCSAGKIGYQVEMAPADLQKAIPYTFFDITQ